MSEENVEAVRKAIDAVNAFMPGRAVQGSLCRNFTIRRPSGTGMISGYTLTSRSIFGARR